MITVADDRPRDDDRRARIAIGVSIVVHLLAVFIYFGLAGLFARLHLFPPPKPKEDQTTMITSTITFERRPKPKRAAPRPPPPSVPQRQAVASVPVPQRVLEPPPVPAPIKRPELAKEAPTAPPAPPTIPPSEPPRKIARVQLPSTSEHVATAQRPSPPSQLSQEQLAAVERDLARTVAQARADTNPLPVTSAEPAGPKHYQMQMFGRRTSDLREAQGVYYPIKGWQDGGWDYYYVSANVTLPDGSVKVEAIPWPIRFRWNADPFNGSSNALIPLAMPLPGWSMPAGVRVDREIRQYANEHGVDL